MSVIRRALAAAAFTTIAALIGCASGNPNDAGKVVVSGRLVENDKPFSFDKSKLKLPAGATGLPPGSESNLLQVVFIPVGGGEDAPATVNLADGTFSVNGADGKGVKPGKFKVSITGGFGPSSPDYFGGKFAAERTAIVKDVVAGQEIVIDVAKPQG